MTGVYYNFALIFTYKSPLYQIWEISRNFGPGPNLVSKIGRGNQIRIDIIGFIHTNNNELGEKTTSLTGLTPPYVCGCLRHVTDSQSHMKWCLNFLFIVFLKHSLQFLYKFQICSNTHVIFMDINLGFSFQV